MIAALIISILLFTFALAWASFLYGKNQGLARLVVREERLIRRLQRDIYKWQNALTVKQGLTPVNESETVRRSKPHESQTVPIVTPFRQAQAEWEEEEDALAREEMRLIDELPPLNEAKRAELRDAARRVAG